MSVTIYSELVDIDGLIPRIGLAEREKTDVEGLIPWVFKNHLIANDYCPRYWPKEESDFRDFFCRLISYRAELDESNPRTISNLLNPNETITLPSKKWEVPGRKSHFLQSQGLMLKSLMETIYYNLEGVAESCPELHFPVLGSKQRYFIGGKRYAARPEGAVVVRSHKQSFPILSYVGWLEGRTSGNLLAENLSIMLGQLASNIGVDPQDQEVFAIGLCGPCIYIVNGMFTAKEASRVHSRGLSENEVFKLNFSRGYDLCLKEDWLEAMHAISRLFRYLLSGNSRVGAIKAYGGFDQAKKGS